MNNISSHSMASASPRHNALSDQQFSSYTKTQSVNIYESMEAGLTIKTKEGDLVSLSSSTYSQMDSYLYDSKGVLTTEAGTASVSRNIREITLSSGESFAFTVSGDLNDEELADIEAIVKGIDEVISQVAGGDMDEAVEKALSMGGYDTVSMYSADINYEKSYAVSTQIQARTEHSMMEKLGRQDEKLLEKAQKPVAKLFRHHFDRMRDDNKFETPRYNAIEKFRDRMTQFFDKMLDGKFAEEFSSSME